MSSDIQLTITPAETPGKLNLSAIGTYNPIMVNVAGVTSFPVGTKTEVKWGNSRLRVALALDVTGSMASAGKMDALKTAAKNLIDQLKNAAAANGDVYVSIIPFSKDVRVDPVNYNANWVKFDWLEPDGTKATLSWDALNGTCACVGTTSAPRNTQQEHLRGSASVPCSKPQYSHARPHARTTAAPGQHADLLVHGRVDSERSQHLERLHHGPRQGSDGVGQLRHQEHGADVLDTQTLFPAEQYTSCPAQMMGLSYDWTALQAIDRWPARRPATPTRASAWHGPGNR